MKRLVAGCAAAILLLSFAVGTVGASPKPAAPVIERLVFILTANAKPAWDDTATDYKLLYGGVKRPGTTSYKVNPAGSGLATDTARSAIDASLETWDVATSFALFATPTDTTQTAVALDGTNVVVWQSLGSGIIGATYLWLNTATKEIIESDTAFSTAYSWGTDGTATAMDLQNIATHEFGHNGLGDLRSPKDAQLTMYGYGALGEIKKRTLGAGDILGIQALYGL